jgi:glycine/serine hydroxymethyltransferase
MRVIAKLIVRVLDAPADAKVIEKVRGEVTELSQEFPLYANRLRKH